MKPQSQLTRQIFRAIIANKPYRTPGCQLQRQHLPHQPKQTIRPFHTSKRRQFFGFLGEGPRPLAGSKATPQNVERALGQLVDVVKARRTSSRPPPEKNVVDALRFLFSARAEKPVDLTMTEIFLITESLQNLVDRDAVLNDSVEATITRQDLQNLSAALAFHGEGDAFHSDARALAELVFQIVGKEKGGAIDSDIFGSYVTVLARAGSTQEALSLLRNSPAISPEEAMRLWVYVLKNERRPAEFQKLLDELHQRLGPLTPQAHEDLVLFATSRGKFGLSKELLDYKCRNRESITTTALSHILQLCIEKGQRSLGSYVAEDMKRRDDLGPSIDVLLLWYATESQQMSLLKRQIVDLQDRGMGGYISMQTFNHLIRHAYRKNALQQVERYIELAEFFGLRPDGSTHALALNHHLARDNINAAVTSFEALQTEDVPDDRSDVPALNKLLQRLTFLKDPPHELIMRVVDRVLETGADLDADTIAGLCSVFLKKNDPDQLSGLVRYRVDAFSRADRARIIAVFKDFILDPATEDQLAWNTYVILRNAFPEMEVPDRVQLMQSFFDRNRPEFACLVFGHMRQRQELEARPTAEAYAQCFFGIAKCKDVDGLQMVYNMLKMDQEVEQTTKVHNSLMAAYPACRTPFTAIIDHYWKVLGSREGPTLSTFLLALRACETWIPHGSLEARRIVALMQQWDMVITKEIYDTYIGAIAGQSEFENAVELIENMEEDIGETPDATTIGVFYNAIPWQYRKDEVERWAKANYPEAWRELESFGDVIDEEWEVRYFKVSREIDTDDPLLFGQGEYDPKLGEQARNAIEAPTT